MDNRKRVVCINWINEWGLEGRIYVSGRKRQYGLEAIDHVIVNKEAIEKVEEIKVDSRVGLRSHATEGNMEERRGQETRGEIEEEEEERTYIVWNKEGNKKFKKETEECKVETEE